MDPANLPIRQYQQQIVDSVRANAVTVVIGECQVLCALEGCALAAAAAAVQAVASSWGHCPRS